MRLTINVTQCMRLGRIKSCHVAAVSAPAVVIKAPAQIARRHGDERHRRGSEWPRVLTVMEDSPGKDRTQSGAKRRRAGRKCRGDPTGSKCGCGGAGDSVARGSQKALAWYWATALSGSPSRTDSNALFPLLNLNGRTRDIPGAVPSNEIQPVVAAVVMHGHRIGTSASKAPSRLHANRQEWRVFPRLPDHGQWQPRRPHSHRCRSTAE